MDAAERAGLQPFAEVGADGCPACGEGESILSVFQRLQLVVGAAADKGEGTLFITQGRVIWVSSAAPMSSAAYAIEFPAISMHAVATDAESSGRLCLYLQLDSGDEIEGPGGESEEGEGEEEEEGPPELRLVPADPSTLDALFQAFCEGAERNPDAEEEGGQGEFFFDEDEVLAGAAEVALGVDVEELVGGDPGRFDDAEEDDLEEGGEEGGDGDAFEEFEQPQQSQQNSRAG
eukprot:scaffold5.g624.t1